MGMYHFLHASAFHARFRSFGWRDGRTRVFVLDEAVARKRDPGASMSGAMYWRSRDRLCLQRDAREPVLGNLTPLSMLRETSNVELASSGAHAAFLLLPSFQPFPKLCSSLPLRSTRNCCEALAQPVLRLRTLCLKVRPRRRR